MVLAALTVEAAALWFLVSGAMMSDARARATERLEVNMRVAWDVAHQHGKTFAVRDNVLYADATPLNGRNETVDRIKRLVGGTATFFMGDVRVATNVVKADGTRGVGTPLAKGPVYDAVLGRGEPFRGEADILGTSYFTAYDPIRNAEGKVIGVLYVGVPAADFLAGVRALQINLSVAGIVVTLVVALVFFLIGRRLFAPLDKIAAAMRALAGGDTAVDMPWSRRGDGIGSMAKAVITFRDAALEKDRVEAAAAATRRQSDEDRTVSETARRATSREQVLVVETVAAGLEHLSAGDLTFRLDEPFTPEYEKLRHDFNMAMDHLQDVMQLVSANVEAMRSEAGQISAASDNLAERTELQASSLDETATALDQIATTVRRTSENAAEARQIVDRANADAERSGAIVGEAVEAMDGIAHSSRQVGQIIGVIDEIAFQTNLLALNAGVEAARAGDAGRGFAVVASEVRALAQRSAEAAKEIKTLIATSSRQVETGVRLVIETGKQLSKVSEQIVAVNQVTKNIASSAEEQSAGLQQINGAVENLDRITQQNAGMVEASRTATQSLALQADELYLLIDGFRVATPETDRPAARAA